MLDWLGGWIAEPIIERKQRKRARGPSWRVFCIALVLALIIGIAIGVAWQEAQLAHAGLL